MSERDLRRRRRRITTNGKSRPSPTLPALLRIRPAGRRQIWRPSENVRVLKRSESDPSLWKSGGDVAVAVAVAEAEEEEGVLYRPGTCSDIFASPDSSATQSPANCSPRYSKDAKVVVNVSVEGSPGPIRTLVKLSSTIGDVTELVVKTYNQQGRTPLLPKHAASTSQLHHSYFSLHSLSKSDLMGDVGSRSFYLRRCSSSSSSTYDSQSSNQMELMPLSLPFLPSFIGRKMNKILRKTRKLWKILGCMP